MKRNKFDKIKADAKATYVSTVKPDNFSLSIENSRTI